MILQLLQIFEINLRKVVIPIFLFIFTTRVLSQKNTAKLWEFMSEKDETIYIDLLFTLFCFMDCCGIVV